MSKGKEQLKELSTNIVANSEALAIFLPKKTTYQVINPRFENPPRIIIEGYDVTKPIAEMGRATHELYVNRSYLPHDWDGNYEIYPSNVWEVLMPYDPNFKGDSFPFHRPKTVQALGGTIFCPELDHEPTLKEIRRFRGTRGVLNTDLLFWYNQTGFVQSNDPENILLDIILRHHKVAALHIGNWILQSLRTADDYKLIEVQSELK